MLPNFLGIGVPRAGTTWLHQLLVDHPDVYVPERRKEVRFFDEHFERGVRWYEGFFPASGQGDVYRAVGEISPQYLYGAHVPERIAQVCGSIKFILLLRNPTDRYISHYLHFYKNGIYTGTFEQFMQSDTLVFDRGLYSKYIVRWLELFAREQFLILIFEEATCDVEGTKRSLAEFLDVDAARYPPGAGEGAVNESYVPRRLGLYRLAFLASQRLREWDLDWLVNWAKAVGVKSAFGRERATPTVGAEWQAHLDARYADEIGRMERLLGRELTVWRCKSA
ncbi:MAG: sulfotransferase domain-containing protein [Chloroflexi bacterium]|nr:sulfotransferase domain-containing protein [Chloroflexota bacterium]